MNQNTKALLILNKKARNGNYNPADIMAMCQRYGMILTLPDDGEDMPLSEIIRQHAGHCELVIIGGGDGTLNMAAQALIDTQLPLGILPLGTANDLARTLGIAPDVESAIRTIATGRTRRIDLGEVNNHLFFNVSSIGFSASLARSLTSKMKKKWGTLGYALAAIKILRQSRPFTATLIHDGEETPIKTVQISVGNGRYYGGGMTVEKNATPDDGRLDVYSLEVSHWWQMIVLFPFIRRGTHGRWRNVRAFPTTSLTIHTRRPHVINADGELIGETPAQFTIHKKAIEVFVP